MSDFISGFFSWGKSKKVEEPKEKEEKEEKEYIFNSKIETEKGNIARKLILESRIGEE